MPKHRPGAVKTGDHIRFHYTVMSTTGAVINSTRNGPPGEMTLGKGQASPGLEKAFRGMLPGERKVVTVESRNAFGLRQSNLMFPVPRAQFPEREFNPGDVVQFSREDGEKISGVVRMADHLMVVFDLNHPLAGHDVIYDIELLEILERGKIS